MAHLLSRTNKQGAWRRALSRLGIGTVAIATGIAWIGTPVAAGPQDGTTDSSGGSSGDTATASLRNHRDQEILSVPLVHRSGTPARHWSCHFYEFYFTESRKKEDLHQAVTPVENSPYDLECIDLDTGVMAYQARITYHEANPGVMLGENGDMSTAVTDVLSTIKVYAPALQMSPPQEKGQLVGIRTWFWFDGWGELSDPREANGFRISVSAADALLEITPGDGGPTKTCTQATAIPWSANDPNRRSDCGYVYHQSGTYEAITRLRYQAVHWEARDRSGDLVGGGTLGGIESQSARVSVLVRDAQAVIN
jgi:hypothetical protein